MVMCVWRARGRMLQTLDYDLNPNPRCVVSPKRILRGDLTQNDFAFYDKDGFELTLAERVFYRCNGHPVKVCLNHDAYTTEWFTFNGSDDLYLDHSLILHRCDFQDEALDQVKWYANNGYIAANWLIQSRQKWGFDIAMEGIDDRTGGIIEILHIEHDCHFYEEFVDTLHKFECMMQNIDWHDAKQQISANKNKWQHLPGYEQNDWKSNFLIGWSKAETTEKAICNY